MSQAIPFADRIEAQAASLSRTESRVALYFATKRHQVLIQSAMELAQAIGTSDATVIRTTRALGFDGLDGMRRAIADELNAQVTPADRASRTIRENDGSLQRALRSTLDTQAEAIAKLRDTLDTATYEAVVHAIADARETAVFGLGPTSSMATYLAMQLRRLGLSARPMGDTGLLFADDLLGLKAGDVVVIMAYGRVYTELSVMLDHTQALGLTAVLITDSLGDELASRFTHLVTVPRGRADGFSLHSATLAFLETILVGLATLMPAETVASLQRLNRLRASLAGKTMKL